jgi:hypothetical protein
MKVEFVRSKSLMSAGPMGPTVRVFSVGDVVDFDDLQAQIFIAQSDAVAAGTKPAKAAAAKPAVEAVVAPVEVAADEPAKITPKAKKTR